MQRPTDTLAQGTQGAPDAVLSPIAISAILVGVVALAGWLAPPPAPPERRVHLPMGVYEALERQAESRTVEGRRLTVDQLIAEFAAGRR